MPRGALGTTEAAAPASNRLGCQAPPANVGAACRPEGHQGKPQNDGVVQWTGRVAPIMFLRQTIPCGYPFSHRAARE